MVWPVPSQPAVNSAKYMQSGPRWKSGSHTGVDFSAPAGRKVVAARPGRVVSASRDAGWAGPNVVGVSVGGGQVDIYGHMRRKTVSVGDLVEANEQVGEVGTMGNSTGNHLHFETRINGRHTDPMPAVRWNNGDVLPPPDEDISGSEGSSPGKSDTYQRAGMPGDFKSVMEIIKIEALRPEIGPGNHPEPLHNPPMFDSLRIAKLYKGLDDSPSAWDYDQHIDKSTASWWVDSVHQGGLARGWIVRDPVALRETEDLPENEYYEGPVNEDGETEPLDENVLRDNPIDRRRYDTRNWSFWFLMNPTMNMESYATTAGVDVNGFLVDVARTNNPPVVSKTGVQMTVNLLLDRVIDQRLFTQYGTDIDTTDYYHSTLVAGRPVMDITPEEKENIRTYGTGVDLEFFFRLLNGSPPDTLMWTGRKTSDFGIMVPYPIIISIGDGPGSRRIRGSIMGATFKHTMFAPGMIPIRTEMSLTIFRHSDAWNSNKDLADYESDEDTGNSGDKETSPAPESGSGEGQPTNDLQKKNQDIAWGQYQDYMKRSEDEDWKKKWTEEGFDKLKVMWMRESSWDHHAENQQTGAYGIPQCNPQSSPEQYRIVHDPEWRNSASKQIAWGLNYIRQRYGNVDSALDFWNRNKWY